jgi:regulation of enolase protein 1 (concanavalin A-like superfamily)
MAILPFPVTPEGAPPVTYDQTGTGLTLTAQAATDLFVDPAGGGPPPDAGRLLGLPPDGDFTLAARVTVGFRNTYDAGALLLYADDRHFAKLCFEYSPQDRPTAVTVVTRGTSDDSNSFEADGETLWLRITRTGAAWAFHASTDGSWWRLLRYFALDAPAPVRVGFLAQSPTGDGCTAAFDDVAFRPGAPKDLRDGS